MTTDDRAVRLALEVGRLTRERDELRARVDTVLPDECWVTRQPGPPFCTDLIGGSIGTGKNPAGWVAEMRCLPCRIRAALEGPA